MFAMFLVTLVTVFVVLRWSVKNPARANDTYTSIEKMFTRGERT
jgi:hypothetical protein